MTEADEYKTSEYIVILLDVLGQGEKLKAWDELPEGAPLEVVRKAVDETAGVVWAVPKDFKYFLAGCQDAVDRMRLRFPAERSAFLDRCVAYETEVEFFSDTCVLFTEIPNEHGDSRVIALLSVLAACSTLVRVKLVEGIPLRGAICIGQGIQKDGRFYGPPLARSHHLESEIAGYPRIIIDKSVQTFLKIAHFSSNSALDIYLQKKAVDCKGFVTPDIDGCSILDHFGSVAYETHRDESVIMGAHEFARTEAKRFRDAGNAKLAIRYHWLQQYIESRWTIWTEKPLPDDG